MFLVELIGSSFLDLISKQARPECRCRRVLVLAYFAGIFQARVCGKILHIFTLPGFL